MTNIIGNLRGFFSERGFASRFGAVFFSFGGYPFPRVYNIIKSPLQCIIITAQDVPFTLLYSHYKISETEETMGCLQTSPQSFIITFSYSLAELLWGL